jgi:hypothetical protein
VGEGVDIGEVFSMLGGVLGGVAASLIGEEGEVGGGEEGAAVGVGVVVEGLGMKKGVSMVTRSKRSEEELMGELVERAYVKVCSSNVT